MENRIARNRKSPSNEINYINAYKIANPAAKKQDGFDIGAVKAKDGTNGHAQVPEGINRSHDNKNYHRVQNFIADTELRKNM